MIETILILKSDATSAICGFSAVKPVSALVVQCLGGKQAHISVDPLFIFLENFQCLSYHLVLPVYSVFRDHHQSKLNQICCSCMPRIVINSDSHDCLVLNSTARLSPIGFLKCYYYYYYSLGFQFSFQQLVEGYLVRLCACISTYLIKKCFITVHDFDTLFYVIGWRLSARQFTVTILFSCRGNELSSHW